MLQKEASVAIISAGEYEETLAEVHLPGNYGLLISREHSETDFDISVHSVLRKRGVGL